MGHQRDLYPEEKSPYIGGKEFVEEHIRRHEEMLAVVAPGTKRAIPKLKDILNEVAKACGIGPEDIQGTRANEQWQKRAESL
jgi:hypothetical protein